MPTLRPYGAAWARVRNVLGVVHSVPEISELLDAIEEGADGGALQAVRRARRLRSTSLASSDSLLLWERAEGTAGKAARVSAVSGREPYRPEVSLSHDRCLAPAYRALS